MGKDSGLVALVKGRTTDLAVSEIEAILEVFFALEGETFAVEYECILIFWFPKNEEVIGIEALRKR